MKEYGLIGKTLAHSFSAPIHAALGCENYSLIELGESELAAFMGKKEFSAINVTIPYKKAVIPYCDTLSETAREVGAVNTVVNRGGSLFADNTDVYGFMYMLRRAGIEVSGRKVLVLGSGGTSLTARCALKKLGAGEIVVISRSGGDNYENIQKHADAGVIVNTTPVGMFPNCPASPLDLSVFPRLSGVVDVVYNPHRTGILMQAEEMGIKNTCGLPMLVAQAKRAEELFFGSAIDDEMIERITKKLTRDTLNIVLIGMPGSGKSSLARILAERTGREVVDTDELIKKTAKMSIPEIFERFGEDGFRRMESDAAKDAGKKSGIIIASGGGIVTRCKNYAPLHQNGRIYHIVRDLSLLATAGRPLSKDAETLEKMERERAPMYESFADVKIENTGEIDSAADAIMEDFYENSCD